ncbi:MAG: DUF1775 domain-containing protein [Thermoleophilia bacterium]
MRRPLACLVSMAALGAGASPAMGHIDVVPDRAVQEQALQLTFRVPNEREVPTIRVRVDFPSKFTVYSLGAPPDGWRQKERFAPDGQVVGVVYSGGVVPVGQYRDFTVLATPFDAGTAVFRSYQTYADGKTKPWTAAPEQQGDITQETGITEPGAAAAVLIQTPEEATARTGAGPGAVSTIRTESGTATWVGIIGILVGVIACAAAGFLWATRPVALIPDDDDDPTTPGSER